MKLPVWLPTGEDLLDGAFFYAMVPIVFQINTISWDSSLLFCGVYDTEHRTLYLTKDSLNIFTAGKFPLVTETGRRMAKVQPALEFIPAYRALIQIFHQLIPPIVMP